MYGVVIADFDNGESKLIDPAGIIDIRVKETVWGVKSLNNIEFGPIKTK